MQSCYTLYLDVSKSRTLKILQVRKIFLNLWIWSDLHLEQQHVEFPATAPEHADVIVCAGDWTTTDRLEDQMRVIIQRYDLPIIFVAGNHEYQGELTFEASRETLVAIANNSQNWNQRVHILDNHYLVHEGIAFIGGTLWTDFLYQAESPAELPWRVKEARSLIRDFQVIKREAGEGFSPSCMLQQNKQTSAFIYEASERFQNMPKVVVSHHIPHERASSPLYLRSATNYLYASSAAAFEDLMHSSFAPSLWICGHTHQVTDVQVGQTRIVSNPMGYQRFKSERQNGFRWDYVVTV